MSTTTKKQLSPKQREEMFKALQGRFERNRSWLKGLDWAKVQARLEAHPDKRWALAEMERTGGEPDVVRQDEKTGDYGRVFVGHNGAQSYYAVREFRCSLKA